MFFRFLWIFVQCFYLTSSFCTNLVFANTNSTDYFYQNPIIVQYQNEILPLSESIFTQDNITYLPLRCILEPLGYTVIWEAETQSILIENESSSSNIRIGQKLALKNNQNIVLDTAPISKNGVTMVSIRFFMNYTDFDFLFSASDNQLSITPANPSAYRILNSVVYIQTNLMQGSGVILSEDGIIATNFHVIRDASSAQIIFEDGSMYTGDIMVVGLDPDLDIAILKIEQDNLVSAKIDESISYKPADSVMSIGSPNGVRNVVSTGIILEFNEQTINTNATISHGSSGGGLFDSNGILLGINYAYALNQNLTIPIQKVLQLEHTFNQPLNTMKDYIYEPNPPKNLQTTLIDNFTYVMWSPVYHASHYQIYMSFEPDGIYTPLYNNTLEDTLWYWAFPYCFALYDSPHTFYIKVSAVVDGIEGECSEILEISSSQ